MEPQQWVLPRLVLTCSWRMLFQTPRRIQQHPQEQRHQKRVRRVAGNLLIDLSAHDSCRASLQRSTQLIRWSWVGSAVPFPETVANMPRGERRDLFASATTEDLENELYAMQLYGCDASLATSLCSLKFLGTFSGSMLIFPRGTWKWTMAPAESSISCVSRPAKLVSRDSRDKFNSEWETAQFVHWSRSESYNFSFELGHRSKEPYHGLGRQVWTLSKRDQWSRVHVCHSGLSPAEPVESQQHSSAVSGLPNVCNYHDNIFYVIWYTYLYNNISWFNPHDSWNPLGP